MTWLQKLSQKPLPLPVDVPYYESRQHKGVDRIDDLMTQETANQLGQEYPEIEYGGSGTYGIAFKTAPDEIMKVTNNWTESSLAGYVFHHPMDWVVPVLSEPQLIQKDPPMWSIRMKRLYPIDDEGLEIFATELVLADERSEFPDARQIEFLIEDEMPNFVEEAWEIYENLRHILAQNRLTLNLTDIHGGNLGWDDDGRLKVFDFGTRSTDLA